MNRHLGVLGLLLCLVPPLAAQRGGNWSGEELKSIRALWIGNLGRPAPDPSNEASENPRAAELGHRLFFDTRFSLDGTVACATCHKPELGFQDGLPLGAGIGRMNRRTMPIAGTAFSPWLFWDGRKDSQWAQALGPLESPVEHGGNRTMYAHLLARYYREDYEAVFGPLPDLGDTARFPASAGPVEDPQARQAWDGMSEADRQQVSRLFANIGKAIAAYERQIQPGPSRFDAFAQALLAGDRVKADRLLSGDERAGLRLFIGRGECLKCHNGPLFTNNDFHNTGVPAAADLPEDLGRAKGARQALEDEFNCLSPYSDASPERCGELRFLKADGEDLVRAFKPPSLRNVAERAPYMHAGQYQSLEEVLRHYSRAPAAPSGHSELEPLRLGKRQLRQLEAFLRALSGPLEAPAAFLRAPVLP